METKIIIRKNAQTSTGYEVVNGDGQVLPIESTYKGEPFTLVLPENTANRKYCNSKKVDNAPNQELTLDYKASIQIGSTHTNKNWESYLTEEERKILDEIKENCEMRKQLEKESILAAKNNPIEKARRKYEKALAELKALESQQQEETFEELE